MAIENLLNRIELGNRFTRAIAVGNPREFSAGDKEEQGIAETCNRLIKNAIVCWNYLLLEYASTRHPPTNSEPKSAPPSPTTPSSHGNISTCWGNTTSPMKSSGIRSAFHPQKAVPKPQAQRGREDPHKWLISGLF